jgi:hypothetical protein
MLPDMRPALIDELRVLRHAWVAWLTPAAVVGLAFLMMPVNRWWYGYLNYDPQGFGELWDDYFSTGVNLYTSGFFAGQLVAMIFGGALVLADRRSADPVRAAKLTVAALGGGVLGLANLAVAAWLAPDQIAHHWSLGQLYATGEPFDPNLLHQPGVWRAILTGLLGFPIWATIGVGATARFAGRFRTVTAVLLTGATLCLPFGATIVGALPARFARVFGIVVGVLLAVAITAGLAGWLPMLVFAEIALVPVLVPPAVATSNVIVVDGVAGDPHPWSAIGVTSMALLYAVGINLIGRTARPRAVRQLSAK